MSRRFPIPDDLDATHSLVRATADVYLREHDTFYDGRIRIWPKPGLFFLRTAPEHVEFVLRALQGLIEASEQQGLEVGPVPSSRLHRAGVGIGSAGNLAAVEVVELRGLGTGSERDISQWRWINEMILPGDEPPPATDVKIPRGNGKLRLVLPRRHDWPGDIGQGWRRHFTGPAGEPFLDALVDALAALELRALAGA
jgi:hypothetical protein